MINRLFASGTVEIGSLIAFQGGLGDFFDILPLEMSVDFEHLRVENVALVTLVVHYEDFVSVFRANEVALIDSLGFGF